jgi:hypothetical protein
MSITEIIASAKSELEVAMKTMPDGVAELIDYEYWGKDFVAKLVSNSGDIVSSWPARTITRTRTKNLPTRPGYQTTPMCNR